MMTKGFMRFLKFSPFAGRLWAAVAMPLLAAAWLGGATGVLNAGEPIRFSNSGSKSTETKADPLREKAISSDKIKGDPRRRYTEGFESIDLGVVPRNRGNPQDLKEEKRKKNEELEKKNWMILDRGELQEKEDQKSELGLPNYDGDSIEKGKGLAELWFGPRQDRANTSKGPSHPGGSARGPNRTAKAEQEDRPPEPANGKGAASKDGETGVFSPAAREAESRGAFAHEPTDKSLKELFAPLGGGLGSSDDRARRDDTGLRGVGSPSGVGKGFGLGRDPSGPPSSLFEQRPGSPQNSVGPADNSRLGSALSGPPSSIFFGPNPFANSSPGNPSRGGFAPEPSRNAFEAPRPAR